MDFWAVRCLEELREAEETGVPAGAHTNDHEMADTVMDFLFASQDASTASLVWMVCLMAGHPLVLAKVRSFCFLFVIFRSGILMHVNSGSRTEMRSCA